jgi:hypothetical protein
MVGQGRRLKQLLDDFKETRECPKLKEEALDRTLWRTCFGRGCGPVVRHWNDGEIGNTMRSRCVYKQRIIVVFCRNLKSLFSVLQTVGYIAQDNPYGYCRQLFKHICITIIL